MLLLLSNNINIQSPRMLSLEIFGSVFAAVADYRYGSVFARHYFNLGLNKKLFYVDFNYDVSRSYGVAIHILHESESSMIGKF